MLPLLIFVATIYIEQFALTEASYVAVRLIQRFDKLENLDFDHDAEEHGMKHNLTLTSCSENGVVVRLHEAEK